MHCYPLKEHQVFTLFIPNPSLAAVGSPFYGMLWRGRGGGSAFFSIDIKFSKLLRYRYWSS